jgi:hypothetical protein
MIIEGLQLSVQPCVTKMPETADHAYIIPFGVCCWRHATMAASYNANISNGCGTVSHHWLIQIHVAKRRISSQ